MVSRQTILDSNLNANAITGLVCVFVGGTDGIGESTVRELFKRTTAPRAYVLARSIDKGTELCRELMESSPGSEAIFLKIDISLLRDVDAICAEIQRREKKINVLFLTAGYMSLKGRNETSEGVDHKMAVNYYSRMRFILNLMPQLSAAGHAGEISRANTVLAAGSEADINMDDLGLTKNFTLHAALAHCVMMTDFMIEALAEKYPFTSFSHSYPGTIKTGIANQLSGPVRLAVKVLYAVMTPWILNVQESGERHVFQITSSVYPSRSGTVGVPAPEGMEVITGMDGVKGSGAYLLDWDGKATSDQEILNKYRDMKAGPKIWEHTMEIFRRANKGKRAAETEAEGHKRPPPMAPNLANWRAG